MSLALHRATANESTEETRMRRQRSKTHAAASQPKPRRRIGNRSAGSTRPKLADVTACPTCGATYRKGRWTWQSAPADAVSHTCPACEQIANGYPAGVLQVEGSFAAHRRDDLIGLVRNVEQRERDQHPLNRFVKIATRRNGFVAETTDGKLAQTLGRPLHKAYGGKLDYPRTTADTENLVRVRWARD
jgi:NMD protein affecting ribosome stability and mRNA decay